MASTSADLYFMFSNFLAEQKADSSLQLGIYGSQPDVRQNIRKLQ